MAVNITGADAYIAGYCIDVEDWSDSDGARKQRLLNVASRTLTTKYPTYTIPDNAVYETANTFAIAFNDTNKLGQQGVTSVSISGTAAFTFKDAGVTFAGADLAKFIPQTALDLISAANGGIKLSRRNVGWTVI
ncbi:hypothetical protein [Paenibacillus sp. SI8]|uniref:hypothetical protein n=1 Tax=unclassified Paenibacillus TaxID=185978 RepID=UPI0034661657